MKIEVMEVSAETALHGGHDECWVRVLSNELVDLERVKAQLTEGQKAALLPYSAGICTYYPHHVAPDEREEHGFQFEDWWVYARPKVSPRRGDL